MLERLPQKLILNCENKKIEINFKINPKNFSRNNGYKLKLKEPLNCSDVIISFISGKKEQSFVRYIIRDIKDSNDRSPSDKILSISNFKNEYK